MRLYQRRHVGNVEALRLSRITLKTGTPSTWWRVMLGHVGAYLLGVLIGIDVTVNAVLGGAPYSTISCRIGESINDGGWASHVHWPAWWVEHCERSIYSTIV